MSSEVYWVYVVRVNEDASEPFRDLVEDLVATSRSESGTLSYHFSISDDGRTVHIFEHYRDSAAVVSHVRQTFGPLADRFTSLARTIGVTVYGVPDASARELIDQWGAVYLTSFGGFVRSA